jgi:hypothetical protein
MRHGRGDPMHIVNPRGPISHRREDTDRPIPGMASTGDELDLDENQMIEFCVPAIPYAMAMMN